jgi:pimeloyl-ACP methyl ester carboxylesterase
MDTTFVLIHGGGLDTWVWERMIPLLDRPALAVRRIPPAVNPHSLTIEDCAKYVQSQIADAGLSKVILVAHSIGGIIAPAVATLLPDQVQQMVFVGATIPPEGRSAISVFPPAAKFAMNMWLWLTNWNMTSLIERAMEADMRKSICNDMDEATTQQVLAGGKNVEPPAIFRDRVSRLNMPAVPCTYIKLLQDQSVLPPAKQDEMAANIGATVLTLDTGHTAMLSRPQELAQLLNGIVNKTAADR